jgi:two-component system phosphate regulon response regulator PhoB
MVPFLSAIEVSNALRKEIRTSQIHIIMLTAKGEEIDRVVGFEVGADDYITKPFSMRELTLRIKAAFRRLDNELSTTDILNYGSIVIDKERHIVLSDGKDIELTSTEFKLLLYLAERSCRVVTREALLQNVWGYDYSGDSRTVDTHITRLRSKLGTPGEQIKTVRGFGYKMDEIHGSPDGIQPQI